MPEISEPLIGAHVEIGDPKEHMRDMRKTHEAVADGVRGTPTPSTAKHYVGHHLSARTNYSPWLTPRASTCSHVQGGVAVAGSALGKDALSAIVDTLTSSCGSFTFFPGKLKVNPISILRGRSPGVIEFASDCLADDWARVGSYLEFAMDELGNLTTVSKNERDAA